MQNLNLWTQNNSLKLWLILSPVLGYHKGLTEGLKPGTLLLWNSVAKPSLLRFGLLSSISKNDGGWEGPLEVPLWLLQSFSVPHLPQCLAQTQRLTAASLMAPHLLVSDTILQSKIPSLWSKSSGTQKLKDSKVLWSKGTLWWKQATVIQPLNCYRNSAWYTASMSSASKDISQQETLI